MPRSTYRPTTNWKPLRFLQLFWRKCHNIRNKPCKLQDIFVNVNLWGEFHLLLSSIFIILDKQTLNSSNYIVVNICYVYSAVHHVLFLYAAIVLSVLNCCSTFFPYSWIPFPFSSHLMSMINTNSLYHTFLKIVAQAIKQQQKKKHKNRRNSIKDQMLIIYIRAFSLIKKIINFILYPKVNDLSKKRRKMLFLFQQWKEEQCLCMNAK